MSTSDLRFDALVNEYTKWLDEQGFPQECAEEIQARMGCWDEDDGVAIKATPEQRAWIEDFIERWDQMMKETQNPEPEMPALAIAASMPAWSLIPTKPLPLNLLARINTRLRDKGEGRLTQRMLDILIEELGQS